MERYVLQKLNFRLIACFEVKVKHVRGVRPQVVLKDGSGNTRQTLNVEKWDTDTLIDFLNQWVD